MKKDKYFFHGHSRLAEEREKLWKTQQEAADFFGVSRVTWGQCERGNATPSGDVLAGLAQRGANVMYILTGNKDWATGEVLTANERDLLALYRAAGLTAKMTAVQALQSGSAPVPSKMVNRAAGSVQVGQQTGGSNQVINKGKKVRE